MSTEPDRSNWTLDEIVRAAAAVAAVRNFYRDPENGPFAGSEGDWQAIEVGRVLDAADVVPKREYRALYEALKRTEPHLHSATHNCDIEDCRIPPGYGLGSGGSGIPCAEFLAVLAHAEEVLGE